MAEMMNMRIESGDPSKELPKTKEEILKRLKEIEKSLENCEAVLGDWTDNLVRLERDVPHDEIVMEDRTLPYHVLSNSWKFNIDQLQQIRGELLGEKEVLEDLLSDMELKADSPVN